MRDRTQIALMSIASIVAVGAICVAASLRAGPDGAYPNSSVPGAANPDVVQDNLKSTVCSANWTRTIRPPASYTNRLKAEQMAALRLPGRASDYEEDHFISLEIGGHPRSPLNLWPEPYAGRYGARTKDKVEDALHRRLCSGAMTLADAQSCVASDWIACGRNLGVVE